MTKSHRPLGFWAIAVFLAVSILVILAGQTLAVFNYELAARFGLQESLEQVGERGVKVNTAFAIADTLVYVPLMVASLIGMFRERRWALATVAAFGGASAYWATTVGFMLLLLPGSPDYHYSPRPEIWAFVGTYLIAGIWILLYLVFRGDQFLSDSAASRPLSTD